MFKMRFELIMKEGMCGKKTARIQIGINIDHYVFGRSRHPSSIFQ